MSSELNGKQGTEAACRSDCVSRRLFLKASGAVTVAAVLSEVFPGRVKGQDPQTEVTVTSLPKTRIAAFSELKLDEPVSFQYPAEGPLQSCTLVKLGEKAGGGAGPDQDVVAFSSRCTHMGGTLEGLYQSQHKVLGPCGEHLTTFDLTRHGIVVAGHATESLPQVILEIEGDDIMAVGMVGIAYGYAAAGSGAAE